MGRLGPLSIGGNPPLESSQRRGERLKGARTENHPGADCMIGAVLDVLLLILRLYTWVVIAAVIASWLVGFGVINTYNSFVRAIVSALAALTEPVFARIRRVMPPFGGLDLSPLVVLIIIYFLQRLIIRAVFF